MLNNISYHFFLKNVKVPVLGWIWRRIPLFDYLKPKYDSYRYSATLATKLLRN